MYQRLEDSPQARVQHTVGSAFFTCLMRVDSFPTGQGAYLLVHPEDISNLYFSSVPSPVFWPMLVLATAATIVASQALITGSFSIIRQVGTAGPGAAAAVLSFAHTHRA